MTSSGWNPASSCSSSSRTRPKPYSEWMNPASSPVVMTPPFVPNDSSASIQMRYCCFQRTSIVLVQPVKYEPWLARFGLEEGLQRRVQVVLVPGQVLRLDRRRGWPRRSTASDSTRPSSRPSGRAPARAWRDRPAHRARRPGRSASARCCSSCPPGSAARHRGRRRRCRRSARSSRRRARRSPSRSISSTAMCVVVFSPCALASAMVASS